MNILNPGTDLWRLAAHDQLYSEGVDISGQSSEEKIAHTGDTDSLNVCG